VFLQLTGKEIRTESAETWADRYQQVTNK